MKKDAVPTAGMTDDDLFDHLREQVTNARNGKGHDRKLTRAVAEEMAKRRAQPAAEQRP